MLKRSLLLVLALIMIISLLAGVCFAENLEKSLEIDTTKLKSSDRRQLVMPGGPGPLSLPDRPENPEDLLKINPLHWWDMEHAGWGVEKINIPESPVDGAINKKVILLKAGDHPYWTAYVNGFKKIAEAYNINIKIYNSNWNMDLQAQQVQQAINERPDAIVVAPVDAKASTILFRRINQAGIPVFGSNTLPTSEGMKYVVAWTGPDDFGQSRLLARHFADTMNKEGGYVILRHMPGASPYFARTWGPITELKDYAPNMELLGMDTANLEAEPSMQLVSDWLTKYGDKLKGIIAADDGPYMIGIIEALKNAGKEPGDVVVVAAGNCKTGHDAVRDEWCQGLTYQSAEGDGAIAIQTVADWFNGKDIDPVVYLPRKIITPDNVEDFSPAQW